MKTVFLIYFAYLRDRCGTGREEFETSARTLGELYGEVQKRYDISLEAKDIRVAVNDRFSSLDSELSSGDHVVFIPPIAGG